MPREFIKRQQSPLSVCVRRINRKPASTNIPNFGSTKLKDKSAGGGSSSTTTTTDADARMSKKKKQALKDQAATASNLGQNIGLDPTPVQQAWEKADDAADAFFAQQKGVKELSALYEVAANAKVHARAELNLNQSERWWWRDIVPSAADTAAKKDSEDSALECDESYTTLEVEKDVDKTERRDAIIQVSQETLILRYAATVLRHRAREWAARRVAAKSEETTRK